MTQLPLDRQEGFKLRSVEFFKKKNVKHIFIPLRSNWFVLTFDLQYLIIIAWGPNLIWKATKRAQYIVVRLNLSNNTTTNNLKKHELIDNYSKKDRIFKKKSRLSGSWLTQYMYIFFFIFIFFVFFKLINFFFKEKITYFRHLFSTRQ